MKQYTLLLFACAAAAFGQAVINPYPPSTHLVPSSGTGTVTVSGGGSLTPTAIVTGAGGNIAQTPSSNCTVDSSGNLSCTSISSGTGAPAVTAGTGGVDAFKEGTAPSVCAASAVDCVYADSTQHGLLASFNNGAYLPLPQGPATSTVGTGACWNSTNGGLLVNCAIASHSISAAYTVVLADANTFLYHPSADTTARTWTIDSNANVAYPVNTCLTFFNDTSAGVLTIAITSDTMILAGAGTTGSRTLAASGVATACKMTTTRWIVNGTGLT